MAGPAMIDYDRAMQATRRSILIGSARLAVGAGLVSLVGTIPARATPQTMRDAIREAVGDAPLRTGRVTLDIPSLVENGNTVPLTVAVDSPMTESDHVKTIHIFNEKNPQPHVITIALGPRAGKARVATRIKLADTQQVVAIAAMSDGSLWTASADVIVTIAACIEDVN
jgi:sulfur-oxidizing protein SoxY